MADPTIALLDYLRKIGADLDGDFLREGAQLLTQMLIELEAEDQIGAGKYERSPDRRARRDSCRERTWETRVGEIPEREASSRASWSLASDRSKRCWRWCKPPRSRG